MSRSSRRVRLPATALALALLAGCGGGGDGDGLPDPGQGYVSGDGTVVETAAAERGAPVELAGTTAEGQEVALADLRGSVVVLNVWYADCPPCREEAPVLQRVSQEYADEGVRFLGINTRNDSAERVAAFQRQFDVSYPSIRDTDGSALLALRGHAPNATPTTLVVDPRGRVAATVAGAVEESTLTALVDAVLAEGGGQPAAAGAAG